MPASPLHLQATGEAVSPQVWRQRSTVSGDATPSARAQRSRIGSGPGCGRVRGTCGAGRCVIGRGRTLGGAVRNGAAGRRGGAGRSNIPAESGDPSEEALDRVWSRWRQLRRTQPAAPESGPGSAEPDSGPVFWVTRDSTTGHPDIGADLETKRQFLADLRDPERRRRAMELVFPQHPADTAQEERNSYEELRTALEDPDTLQALQALQAKSDELQAATEQRLRQAAEALAHLAAAARAPHAPGRAVTRQNAQASSSPRPQPLHHSRARVRRSTGPTRGRLARGRPRVHPTGGRGDDLYVAPQGCHRPGSACMQEDQERCRSRLRFCR